MKYIIILFIFSASAITAFTQSNDRPTPVTPAIEKKIAAEVAKELVAFKNKLTAIKENAAVIEFSADTFQIENYAEKYMAYDWSTAGMRQATYKAASDYDRVLNKYYQKLLGVLQKKDQQILVNAQRSWIRFRDEETKLVLTVSKDVYSGGGTIQQLENASAYSDLIKERAITLFQYYQRATQNY